MILFIASYFAILVLAVFAWQSARKENRQHLSNLKTLEELEKDKIQSLEPMKVRLKISENSLQSLKYASHEIGNQVVELQKILLNLLSKAKTL